MNSTMLLTYTEKQTLLSDLKEHMDALEAKLFFPIGTAITESSQSGNWPLKVRLALGYAALGQQVFTPPPEEPFAAPLQEPLLVALFVNWLDLAYKNAGDQASADRSKRWSYQTSNGKPYWAEGAYYLHLSLSEVIPFWHAIRANGMLSWNGHTVTDPFNSAWFTTPMSWLADTVTPEGRILPLDDGNRAAMQHTNMLRWAGTYGNQSLGEKFAWIQERPINNSFANLNIYTRLVEIAMPRTETVQAPVADLVTGVDNQQLLIRRPDGQGQIHYLVLNGETGDAQERGEGHEQGDQLQLLYHIDGTSYVLDSGYDNADFPLNSTWNKYNDHNVMQGYMPGPGTLPLAADGGVWPPYLGCDIPPSSLPEWLDYPSYLFELGDLVGCLFSFKGVHSEHLQPVDQLSASVSEGNLDIFSGQIGLEGALLHGPMGRFADYKRTTIMVNDPDKPYVIDLNAAWHDDTMPIANGYGYEFDMKYHVNSGTAPQVSQNGDNRTYLWQNLYNATRSSGTLGTTDNHVVIQPYSVEFALNALTPNDTALEVFKGDQSVPDPIQALLLQSGPPGSENVEFHSTVAFIRGITDTPSPAVGPEVEVGVPDPTGLNFNLWRYYTWQHDPNTLDVLVARSGVVNVGPQYRVSISFILPQAHNTRIELPTNEDYGFVRLIHNGTTWVVDPNYDLNLTVASPIVYSTNTTEYSAKTFLNDQVIRVTPGVTVTFDGFVTLEPGVIFDLDNGAQVNFDGGVSAQGTSELPIHFNATGSVQPSVVLRGGSSTLTKVYFEGGPSPGPSLTLSNAAQATISGTTSFQNGIGVADAAVLTIAASSTVHVASIGVEWQARLTIYDGVDIYTDYGLGAEGVIEILGTINDPVDIRPLNNPTWEEIYLSGGYTSGSRFEYVRLFDTRKGIYAKKGSNMTLKAVKAYGVGDECSTTLMLMSGVTVNQSRFTGSTYGLCSYMSSVGLVSSSVDNHFYNNSSAGLWASGASTVVFGAHSVPAHISSYGNATGLLVEDQTTVKIGEWIPYSQVVRGGTNTVYNNTAYDVEAHNYGLVFAEYTWWGQAVPQTSQFMSTGDSEINYDNPLTSQPTLPPTSAYSSIEPVLAKREMVQVHPQTQQLTGLTLAGVATLSRLTKAGYIEEMRRLRAQQGRGASLAALTSYVQERGSQDRLAAVSQLLRLEDMVALGHVEAVIGQAKALRARGTLEPTEQEQVGVLLFLAYLDGNGDVEAAEAELKALPDRGRTRTVAHVLQHLLDKAKGASGDAWSKRGLTRSTPPREAVPAEMLHQQDVVADASSETIASAVEVSVYPNPFNPSTLFAYRVPEVANVRLSVYDMVGREVAVLVEGVEQAGVHNVSFDGTQLASGLYLYQLRVGDEVLTGRIHLLK